MAGLSDLYDLNNKEILTLYWKCKGKTIREIRDLVQEALKLSRLSTSTIHNYQKSGVDKLYPFEDLPFEETYQNFRLDYGEILNTLDPADLVYWPPESIPLFNSTSKAEEKPQDIPKEEPPSQESRSARPVPSWFPKERPKRFRWPLLLLSIPVLILCGVCWFGSVYLAQFIPLFNRTQPSPVALQEDSNTIEPLQQAPVNPPTDFQLPSPTEFIPPQPTDTPAPTQTQTQTNTPPPTNTPGPTNTPRPTPTLEPQPVVLFEDDFSGGLAPEWSVVQGSPNVVNGILTPSQDDDLILLVTGQSFDDFVIEADGFSKDGLCGRYNGIIARATDARNMIYFGWDGCRVGWIKVENGNESLIPGSVTDIRHYNKTNRFKVSVSGSNIVVDFLGETFTYFDDQFTNGVPGIRLGRTSWYNTSSSMDYVRISLP